MKHIRVMEHHNLKLLSNGSGKNALLYYYFSLYVSLRFLLVNLKKSLELPASKGVKT